MANGIGSTQAESTKPSWQTTLIVLAVLIGSAVLTYFDKVSGDAFVGIVGGIIGGVLVRQGVASGSAATNSPPPPQG